MLQHIFQFAILLIFLEVSTGQQCKHDKVEWFPHPTSCQKFFGCIEGTRVEFSCGPGLEFSTKTLRCMVSAEANCIICPKGNAWEHNIFIPDKQDCKKYYVCNNGIPFAQTCGDNLYWDKTNNWCTTKEKAECGRGIVTGAVTEAFNRKIPNLSGCWKRDHLYSNSTSAYIKSVCTVNQGKNYDQAEAFCRANNMELFILDSSNTQKALMAAMKTTLNGHPNGHVWVNGKGHRNDVNWFTFGPQKAQLFDKLDWYDEECLLLKGRSLDYKPIAAKCDVNGWFLCEFHESR